MNLLKEIEIANAALDAMTMRNESQFVLSRAARKRGYRTTDLRYLSAASPGSFFLCSDNDETRLIAPCKPRAATPINFDATYW